MTNNEPINGASATDLLDVAIDRLSPHAHMCALFRASGIRIVAPPEVLERLRQRGEAGGSTGSEHVARCR